MTYPSAATARIDPEPLSRDPVGRMAADMRSLHLVDGVVTERDLRRYGWSAAQVARYGEAARERLRAQLDAEAERRQALRGDAAAAMADAAGAETVQAPRRPTRPRTTPPRALGQGRRSGDGQ